jgi:hypothetical protein
MTKRLETLKLGPNVNARVFWKVIKEINEGIVDSGRKDMTSLKLSKKDGTLCSSIKENAEVVEEEMYNRFNKSTATFDDAVLELVTQRKENADLKICPTLEEIVESVKKMKNNKAAGESGIPAEFFKALIETEEGLEILYEVVKSFWEGVDYEKWKTGLLKLLPKKGNLSLVKNWRGIMLLEIGSKLVSSIIATRLGKHLGVVGMEEQCGFMSGRGCSDATFNLKNALKKRLEHNLDSYALFIDLVKAFDSVPRDGLMKLLPKFGIPDELVKIIKRMHEGIKVKIDIEGEEVVIDSTIGVKQGDNQIGRAHV